MRAFIFEGSPEEIREAVQSIIPANPERVIAAGTPEGKRSLPLREIDSEHEKRFVTQEFARRVLTRRPTLSGPVKRVLQMLQEAHPGWVTLGDLHVAAGYTPQQFAGLMGAFGRRMSHTDGYDPHAHFFDYQLNRETENWEYAMPVSVHQAMLEDSET